MLVVWLRQTSKPVYVSIIITSDANNQPMTDIVGEINDNKFSDNGVGVGF